jgi:hypothetical protein
MKRKITIATYAMIIACCLIITSAYAQLIPIVIVPNYGQTDPGINIESIGIGDFNGLGSPNYPLSALHINTNLFTGINAPSYASLGEVFRTDCPEDISTYWRMHRGGVEYGMLYSLSRSDDFAGTGTGEGIHFYGL